MKAFFFWEEVGGLTLEHRCNPYAGLLAMALEKQGITLELGDYEFRRSWLRRMRTDFQVLHMNWLWKFYRRQTLEDTMGRLAHFTDSLLYAKKLGYRIIWTMHNFLPHERPFPHVDRMANLAASIAADAVIAHCRHGADLLAEHYHRTDAVHVIPHGHFIDVFPNTISRREARMKLSLPEDAFVYLFLGNARAYKGIEILIEAFKRIDGPDSLLLLMMKQKVDMAYGKTLLGLAEGSSRIRIATSLFFPNEVFQDYVNAADVAVFPFHQVLTSGSVIAALSFGRPVIGPRLGCLPELVGDKVGILYDSEDAEGLEKALRKIREKDTGKMGRAARKLAESLDWDGIARQTAALYRG